MNLQSVKIDSLEEYYRHKDFLYSNVFSKLPLIGTQVPKGTHLYRTVPVTRHDMTIGRQGYLSYRPQRISYPYFNRCSEPNQSHFYCSDDRWLSMAECSYFISNSSETEDYKFDRTNELLEVGIWTAEENLFVMDLRYGEYLEKHAKGIITERKERYESFVKDPFLLTIIEELHASFERPIKKDEHFDYWLTACLSNYIFDDKYATHPEWGNIHGIKVNQPLTIDGIIYHSVKGISSKPPLKGHNLVFSTKLIDEGKIKLIRAGVFETKQIEARRFEFDILRKQCISINSPSWYYTDV